MLVELRCASNFVNDVIWLPFFSVGYQGLKENVTNGKADNHEGIDFYKPVLNPDKAKVLQGENQWPSVPGFKEKYEKWIEKMKGLGLIVMEASALVI